MAMVKVDERVLALVHARLMQAVDMIVEGLRDAEAEDGTMQRSENHGHTSEDLALSIVIEVPWMSTEKYEDALVANDLDNGGLLN